MTTRTRFEHGQDAVEVVRLEGFTIGRFILSNRDGAVAVCQTRRQDRTCKSRMSDTRCPVASRSK